MSQFDTPGFRKFKQQRTAGALTPADNDLYEAFVSAATGEQAERDAGRAQHLEPGGPDAAVSTPDSVVYQGYLDLIDGTAGRRKAEATVRREREERQAEHKRHANAMGYPLPTLFQD